MSKNRLLARICRECGIEFLGGPRAWYCPKCRLIRKKEADKRMKQKRKTLDYIPLGSVIHCKMCGKETIKNSGQQLYCPECAPVHLKEIDNAQSLEWKRKHPDKIREGKRNLSKRRHGEEGKESGIKYISWDKAKKKWKVCPYKDGKQVYVGVYKKIEDAENKLNEFLKNK